MIQPFQTDWSLSNIKSDHLVFSTLKTHKLFLSPHYFPVDVWDTVSLGWLKGLHCGHVLRSHAESQLSAHAFPDEPSPICLFPGRITSGVPNSLPTRAYEVHCARSDSARVLKALKAGPPSAQVFFIPFKLKHSYPDSYKHYIQEQTHLLGSTWVIKLGNLPPSMLSTLETHLSAAPHLMSIQPTRHPDEWKLLVPQQHHSALYSYVASNWSAFLDQLPTPDSTSSHQDPPLILSKRPGTSPSHSPVMVETPIVPTFPSHLSLKTNPQWLLWRMYFPHLGWKWLPRFYQPILLASLPLDLHQPLGPMPLPIPPILPPPLHISGPALLH